ncbi:GNAT family N-acetyltransferase [Metabacillus dongyingensis]|uniref:GNAT family N-acetyltransferase n=1 Tax=Metabacillus dongyingensis TaxID=2874282 RepID=UPI003B8CE37B
MITIEGNPEIKEGNIEYKAVSSAQRKKVIGTRLIKSALHFLFAELGIEEITICVEAKNEFIFFLTLTNFRLITP